MRSFALEAGGLEMAAREGEATSSVARPVARARLRELPGILQATPERERLSFSLFEGGIPRAAVSAIHGAPGSGKSEAVLRLLAEHPRLRAAWLEESLTVYPCAFPLAGVSLERVLFAEPGEHTLWSAHQILRSQLFGIVTLTLTRALTELELRRLQLSAEKCGASLVLLSEKPIDPGAWTLSLELEATRDVEGRVRLWKR